MSHAVIDIGTNTLILLIGKPLKSGVKVLHEEACVTRLGQGLSENHFFLPEAMKRTLAVLNHFKEVCKKNKVTKIHAVGTASFRLAANVDVFLDKVQEECGLAIKVISGEEEAELVFDAAYRDFGKRNKMIVVDIGGGSTEVISGPSPQKKKKLFDALISLPFGSVRLTEQYVTTDPISDEQFHRLKVAIVNGLKDNLEDDVFPSDFDATDYELVATAGTATTLASIAKKLKKYVPEKVHGTTLTRESLEDIVEALKHKSLRDRQAMPGLEPLRADVILAGGLLLLEIMNFFKKEKVTISDRGLRYGVFYKRFCK